MTESKISNYFTPYRSVKRRRSRSSPASPSERQTCIGLNDMANDEEKVGDLTKGQLRCALRDVMSELLDTKLSNLATKDDLLNLSNQVSDLRESHINRGVEIRGLKMENKLIMNKLLDLESRARRNNLIFRGLKWGPRTSDFKEVVGRFCSETFGNNQICINRAHPLGKEKDTIIAHLPYDADIDYIMSRVSDLKNTGFAVYRDFPREIRVKRACLSAVRSEVERVAGRRRMPLVHDHLTIDRCRFTWEDGKLMAGRECGVNKLQTMFGHDFSAFVRGLKDPPPRRPRESNIQSTHPPNGSDQGTEEAARGTETSSGGGDGDSRERGPGATASYAQTLRG
jgi:hypothetical protein